ncbi:MAG: hypothetical protein GX221_08785 [Candidatus Riflebacteria bacterium]|nr:hypothetical protein [Candidatus Riflebacteria bacterium]
MLCLKPYLCPSADKYSKRNWAFVSSKSAFILSIAIVVIFVLSTIAFTLHYFARNKSDEILKLIHHQRIKKAARSLLLSAMFRIKSDLNDGDKVDKEKLIEIFQTGNNSRLNLYLQTIEPALQDVGGKILSKRGGRQLADSSALPKYNLKGKIMRKTFVFSSQSSLRFITAVNLKITLNLQVGSVKASSTEERRFKIENIEYNNYISKFLDNLLNNNTW